MAIKGLNPNQSAMWSAKFERAHREGPEAFARVWMDLIKVAARRKAKETGDPGAVWNPISAELDRIYADHCL